MGTNWGLFLCNCRRTLPLDPERLVLPTAPSVLSFASDPEIDIKEFAARANRERLDRVLNLNTPDQHRRLDELHRQREHNLREQRELLKRMKSYQ